VRPLPGLFVRAEHRLHPWQQRDAVKQWIEPLTDPGDLVVDPFYGSGEWGHICGAMGRKWIGSDDGSAGNAYMPAARSQ
jgi:hypothetical protein